MQYDMVGWSARMMENTWRQREGLMLNVFSLISWLSAQNYMQNI